VMTSDPAATMHEARMLEILYFEDVPDDVVILRSALEDAAPDRFRITSVGTLADGLVLLGRTHFDAALLDLNLPDSRGIETYERLQEADPDLPVIVLTGRGDSDFAQSMIKRGLQDFLPKRHLSGYSVANTIQFAIERQRLTTELEHRAELLIRSESRIRGIIESMVDAVVVTDDTGLICYVNPAAESLFGLLAATLIAQPFGYAMSAGSTSELVVATTDGARTVEMRVVATEWEGAPALLASLHDVTERVQLYENLKTSECIAVRNLEEAIDAKRRAESIAERLEREIIEHRRTEVALKHSDSLLHATGRMARVGGWEYDVATGMLTWTEEVYEMLGLDHSFIPTLDAALELMVPASRATFRSLIDRMIRDRLPIDADIEFVTAREQLLCIHLVAQADNVDGRVSRIWGAGQDVTAARQAAQRLRESEERFSKAFHASPMAIGITRISDGVFLDVNDAACELFGYRREEIVGHSTIELSMWPGMPERMRFLSERASDNRMANMDMQLHRHDGTPISVQFSSETIELGGEECRLSICIDVTERKQAAQDLLEAKERAERSDSLKDAFIANISHEIRTPLNVILGFSELIETVFQDRATERERRFFASLRSGADRLTRTVDLILSFSRLKTGDITLKPAAFDLPEFLNEQVQLMLQLALKRDLAITFRNSLGPAVMTADRYCMSQVLGNLLDNAIKFTQAGSILVKLYADESGVACIDVADTGIGMSPEYLDRLFLPYTQEMIGHTRAYDGIGLGLALVHRYLELHGMRIEVKSRKGLGSSFTIHTGTTVIIPAKTVAPAPAEPETPRNTSTGPVRASRTSVHVLVVDDDSLTREYMMYMLGEEYSVALAANRDEALQSIAEQMPDVVLMDLSLQEGVDGLDIVAELRAHPSTANLHVIAVTAHAFPADEARCLEAGCDGYLAKPVSKQILFERIETFVQRRDAAV
jgi:PAS domain S-box-containing protein